MKSPDNNNNLPPLPDKSDNPFESAFGASPLENTFAQRNEFDVTASALDASSDSGPVKGGSSGGPRTVG